MGCSFTERTLTTRAEVGDGFRYFQMDTQESFQFLLSCVLVSGTLINKTKVLVAANVLRKALSLEPDLDLINLEKEIRSVIQNTSSEVSQMDLAEIQILLSSLPAPTKILDRRVQDKTNQLTMF